MEDSFGRPFDLIFGDGGGSSLFTDFCVIKTENALLDLFETSPKLGLPTESPGLSVTSESEVPIY